MVSLALSKKVGSVTVNGSRACAGAAGIISAGVTGFAGLSETTAAMGLLEGIPDIVLIS